MLNSEYQNVGIGSRIGKSPGKHQRCRLGWRGSQTRGASQDPPSAGPPERRCPRELSNRRPGKALRRLEVPPRPSPAQGQTGNSSAKPSGGSPGTRPLNSTSRRGLHPVPPPAVNHAAATPGGTDAPDGAAPCDFEGRDRPAGGGSTSASELAPGRHSATHAASSGELRPTQPSGAPQQRGRDEPTPRSRSYPSFRLAL